MLVAEKVTRSPQIISKPSRRITETNCCSKGESDAMQADGSMGVAGEAGCLLNGTCFFFFAGTGVAKTSGWTTLWNETVYSSPSFTTVSSSRNGSIIFTMASFLIPSTCTYNSSSGNNLLKFTTSGRRFLLRPWAIDGERARIQSAWRTVSCLLLQFSKVTL